MKDFSGKQAKAYIEDGDLGGFLTYLDGSAIPDAFRNEITPLKAKYNRWKKEKRSGGVSHENLEVKWNKLLEDCTDLLNDIISQYPQEPEIIVKHEVPKTTGASGSSPGKDKVPKLVQIFIAYSRKDARLLGKLRTHLTPLTRGGEVKVWYDGEIRPGKEWEKEIKTHLHTSDIILLLVSADAIASNYFYDKEMPDALLRHEKGEAIVVPVILRPCDWQQTPLGFLQALPKDGLPVTDWKNWDKAFEDVAVALRKIVEERQGVGTTGKKEPGNEDQQSPDSTFGGIAKKVEKKVERDVTENTSEKSFVEHKLNPDFQSMEDHLLQTRYFLKMKSLNSPENVGKPLTYIFLTEELDAISKLRIALFEKEHNFYEESIELLGLIRDRVKVIRELFEDSAIDEGRGLIKDCKALEEMSEQVKIDLINPENINSNRRPYLRARYIIPFCSKIEKFERKLHSIAQMSINYSKN